MDLREIGWGGVDWIRLAQNRDWWRAVVSAVDEPSGSCATDLVAATLPKLRITETGVTDTENLQREHLFLEL
jgi:hypothetical protein